MWLQIDPYLSFILIIMPFSIQLMYSIFINSISSFTYSFWRSEPKWGIVSTSMLDDRPKHMRGCRWRFIVRKVVSVVTRSIHCIALVSTSRGWTWCLSFFAWTCFSGMNLFASARSAVFFLCFSLMLLTVFLELLFILEHSFNWLENMPIRLGFKLSWLAFLIWPNRRTWKLALSWRIQVFFTLST